MRSFVYAAVLGAVSIALQGCGGGGGSQSSSVCINEHVDLVTQSVQGSSNGNVSIKLDVTGIDGLPAAVQLALAQPILVQASGSYDLKFDLEKFNVRLDATDTFEVEDIVTLPVKATVDGTVIFNAAKNELVVASGITIDAFGVQIPIKNSCNISSIAGLPSLTDMTEMFNEIKAALQSTTQCEGSDGTYDDWKFSPAAIPAMFPVTVGVGLRLDKNYLWKQVLFNFSGHMPHPMALPTMLEPIGNVTVQSMAAEGDVTLKSLSVLLSGPTATDLDYKQLTHTCASALGVGITDIVDFLVSQRMEAQAIVATIAASEKRAHELFTV